VPKVEGHSFGGEVIRYVEHVRKTCGLDSTKLNLSCSCGYCTKSAPDISALGGASRLCKDVTFVPELALA